MSNSVYQINKGINQSIQFQGLKAQYIGYLGGAVVGLLIVFAALYIMGVPSLFCVGFIATTGAFTVFKIYKMSHQYGQYGLMKALARKQIPKCIKVYSRGVFMIR
ncbi:hypothetical protein ASC72_10460 [Flavobacterium sp. Root420]|nr:DUF4133 domain-containing protein [Flavobacterium sp. Root420]KQW99477.1 hypothetical protein ASC72_10460 [Flavobacterium sp. Root420]